MAGLRPAPGSCIYCCYLLSPWQPPQCEFSVSLAERIPGRFLIMWGWFCKAGRERGKGATGYKQLGPELLTLSPLNVPDCCGRSSRAVLEVPSPPLLGGPAPIPPVPQFPFLQKGRNVWARCGARSAASMGQLKCPPGSAPRSASSTWELQGLISPEAKPESTRSRGLLFCFQADRAAVPVPSQCCCWEHQHRDLLFLPFSLSSFLSVWLCALGN